MADQNAEAKQQPPTAVDAKQPNYSKAAGYFELYANNVFFETNVWDLNLVFGLLDQEQSMPPFKRLGSVHVPWQQAKIMAYYLMINIAWQERTYGPINVPESVRPAPFEDFAKTLPDNETTKALIKRAQELRAELGW